MRNSSRYSRGSRSQNRGSSHFGLWIFTIILFAAFTFGLVYLGKHKHSETTKTIAAEPAKNIVKEKETEERPKQKPVAPHKSAEQNFEFYDILTQSKIDKKEATNSVKTSANVITTSAKTNSVTSTGNQNSLTNKNTSTTNQTSATATEKAKPKPTGYMVEVLKTKDFEVVDRAKAELALIGYEVNIESFKVNDATKYVVTIGPYKSKDEALKTQKQLLQNDVKSTIKPMRN
jgi:cell division protein FtsN